MRFGEMAHDRQAQPQPAMPSRRRAVSLPEALEHVLEEVAGNALPGIRDGDRGARVAVEELDVDPAVPWRELDRVGQQVPENLA